MLHKSIPALVKDIDAKQGIVTVYASSFNVIDDGRDRVRAGAFTKTIAEWGPSSVQPRIKWLWQHDAKSIIGKPLELRQDEFGLLARGQAAPTTLGKDTLILYEYGVITEHSIGYDTIDSDYDRKADVRDLLTLKLYEYSSVTWGMNQVTPTVSVKSLDGAQPPTVADRIARIDRVLHAANLSSDEVGVALERELKHLQSLTAPATEPTTRPWEVTAVKAASGKTTWPLGDRDAAWDGAGAHNRIVKWATDSDGNVDAAKLKSVHFWFDDSAPDKITSYKLLFCDVQAGDVKAMPKGIFACAGAHGIETADIPSGEVDAVKDKIAAYYKRMAKEFDDDTIVAPWETDNGGKGKSMPTKPKPTEGAAQPHARKARDFDTLFASLSASDELQDAWGDTFIAFVQCMYELMSFASGVTNGWVPDDQAKGFDATEAAQANVDAFGKAVMALVAQSLAADFSPCLDCDGDQFLDPDGVNAGEDDYYKAAPIGDLRADIQSFRMRKAGRVMSGENHAMMSKALDQIATGHKAIAAFLKQNNPANAGDEPPAETDPTYDPGFGKSRQGAPHTATRAGATHLGKQATTPAHAGAGAATTHAGQATTHDADNADTTDDEMAQFRALMVRMRQEANAARAVAS